MLLWILLLIPSHALCHKVIGSDEQTDLKPSITTLYPINNYTVSRAADAGRNETTNNSKENINNIKQTSDVTKWKIETPFGVSDLVKNEDNNVTNSKEDAEKISVETARNCDNCSEGFKPSQLLGEFSDETSTEVTQPSFIGSFTPNSFTSPPAAFVSSARDELQSTNATPSNFVHHRAFPYNFGSKAKSHRKPLSLESKPTVESPVSVPAGGLYKFPGAFKEKPGLNSDDEEFGLEFNDDQRNAMKKRVNPWKNLLRLVTAFIPVGLIISALTPSIITIQNTDNYSPPNLHRRFDQPSPLAISEQCRRRLLCELHSDTNYVQYNTGSRRRRSQCYKLHCDNERALYDTLRWLLQHKPHTHRHRVGHYT